MSHHRVVFLEDDRDLRDAFADFASIMGSDCLKLASYQDLLDHRGEVLDCDRAILDVNLGAGEPSGLDAFRWLRAQGFSGKVVFLTGHAATHPLVAEAHQIGNARVVAKPATVAVLHSLLDSGGEP
jgi:FixJ family two-component response regulator